MEGVPSQWGFPCLTTPHSCHLKILAPLHDGPAQAKGWVRVVFGWVLDIFGRFFLGLIFFLFLFFFLVPGLSLEPPVGWASAWYLSDIPSHALSSPTLSLEYRLLRSATAGDDCHP